MTVDINNTNQDAIFDENTADTPDVSADSALDQTEVEQKIGELEQKLIDTQNSWKRALADYKNLQTRSQQEKQEFAQYANSSLILKFLSILDNLEMIKKHSEDMGLDLTIKEFNRILSEEGVTKIECENCDYDATTMDAIEMVAGEKNKVVEVLRDGYMFKEKILRPATVKVGNGEESVEKA